MRNASGAAGGPYAFLICVSTRRSALSGSGVSRRIERAAGDDAQRAADAVQHAARRDLREVAHGQQRDAGVLGDRAEMREEGHLPVGATVHAIVEQQVQRVEHDETRVVEGADRFLKLRRVPGQTQRQQLVRGRRTNAIERHDAAGVGARGGEPLGKRRAVLGCGEEHAHGSQPTGVEAADVRTGGFWRRLRAMPGGRTFDSGVVRPGAGSGQARGQVGGKQRLADAGIADEQRKAAQRQALRPEPVDLRAGGVVEEAGDGDGRGWRAWSYGS